MSNPIGDRLLDCNNIDAFSEVERITQKISEITEEINKVAKNLNVGTGQATYKAVGEADVLSAVKPIEIKHGVYSYPVNRNIVETNVLTTTTTKTFNGQETTTEKNQLFMRIETIYRFVNIEKPDEYVEVTTEAVLKRSLLKELCHKLFGINATAQVKRKLESAEVYLIAEVCDFLELSFFCCLFDHIKSVPRCFDLVR